MKKKAIIIVASFLCTGCSYYFGGNVRVVINAQNNPVVGAKVQICKLDSMGQRSEPCFIGITDTQGELATTLNFQTFKKLKLQVTSSSLDPLYLPVLQEVNAPAWWQEQSLTIPVQLTSLVTHPLPRPIKILPSEPTAKVNSSTAELASPFFTETIPVKNLEQNLIDPDIKVEDTQNSSSTSKHFYGTRENIIPEIKTITEKRNKVFSIKFLVLLSGKKVKNASLIFLYKTIGASKKLGETDSEGKLNATINKTTIPDFLVVKAKGAKTLLIPFSVNYNDKEHVIELTAGASKDFLLQNFAYGKSLGLEKYELWSGEAKQNISDRTGFMTVPANPTKFEKYHVIWKKNGLSNKIQEEDIFYKFECFDEYICPYYVSSSEFIKPIVGLLEPDIADSVQSDPLWRRARRAFFAKFINERSFTTKINNDLKKIVQVPTDELSKQLNSGWENSTYAYDLDLLFQLKYFKDRNILSGKLIQKNGDIVFEQSSTLTKTNAEQTGEELYEIFLSKVPWEAAILKRNGRTLQLNVGKVQGIHLGDKFTLYGSENNHEIAKRKVGELVVKKLEDKTCSAEIQQENKDFLRSLVLRAVRIIKR